MYGHPSGMFGDSLDKKTEGQKRTNINGLRKAYGPCGHSGSLVTVWSYGPKPRLHKD